MWAVVAYMHDTQALCGLLHPLYGLLHPLCILHMRYVGYEILYVGCCSMHACHVGGIWAVASSMWAVTSKDRERRQVTTTRNEDGEPRLITENRE